MKVLHLLPNLNQSAGQLALERLQALATADSALVLGPAYCAGKCRLRLDFLQRRSWFDLDFVWKLREYLQRSRPDVIHAWGLEPIRSLALADWSSLSRVVLSQPIQLQNLGWLHRQLLARVRRSIVHEPQERNRLDRLGLKQVSLIAPGVTPLEQPSAPCNRPRIVCLGTADVDFGFRDAIWAFDILRYVVPDGELVIVGTPADLKRAALFAQVIGNPSGIHFHPNGESDRALESGRIVWVVGRGDASWPCLRAQASGRALISMAPSMVIRPGETGLLVPAGDKVALAKSTWKLLEDTNLREHLASAGRRLAREAYPLESTVAEIERVYREITANRKLAA